MAPSECRRRERVQPFSRRVALIVLGRIFLGSNTGGLGAPSGNTVGQTWRSRLARRRARSDLIIRRSARAAPLAAAGTGAETGSWWRSSLGHALLSAPLCAERERLSSAPVIWIHSIGPLCLTRMERPDARHVCSPGLRTSESCAASSSQLLCLPAERALRHGEVLKARSAFCFQCRHWPSVTGAQLPDAVAPFFA